MSNEESHGTSSDESSTTTSGQVTAEQPGQSSISDITAQPTDDLSSPDESPSLTSHIGGESASVGSALAPSPTLGFNLSEHADLSREVTGIADDNILPMTIDYTAMITVTIIRLFLLYVFQDMDIAKPMKAHVLC